MHYGTYAVNQTGSTWQTELNLTELGSNQYFEPVMQLTWVGSKYSQFNVQQCFEPEWFNNQC